ncbi:NAD-dependent epimerase/dehydratase family protein [Candidatus Micrarchaeota archaeon]|nr:NAD-dependent epimerase/dehydratase family protein [Candidatus Micrarchaeota archaeon]
MSNVLVTGGAGFIGSNVVRQLVEAGHDVTVADNLSKGEITNLDFKKVKFKQVDLCDAKAVAGLLTDVEYCFHFAARIGGIGYFHKYPAEILRDNTLMYSNLLDEARKARAFEKMIYISSSMVFERTEKFPSREEDIFTAPPPISHYGFSKLVGEYYSTAFHDQYGMKYTTFRPFNAYGPGEVPHNEPGMAHVIPDLIKKVYYDKQDPVEIFGAGTQVRAYTYVTDLANAVATLSFDKRTDNNDYNVAHPDALSVMDLLERIWKMCGPSGKPLRTKSVKAYKDDVQKRIPSVDKVLALGWKPKVSIDQGLTNTFEWIKAKHKSN